LVGEADEGATGCPFCVRAHVTGRTPGASARFFSNKRLLSLAFAGLGVCGGRFDCHRRIGSAVAGRSSPGHPAVRYPPGEVSVRRARRGARARAGLVLSDIVRFGAEAGVLAQRQPRELRRLALAHEQAERINDHVPTLLVHVV
jgi:hypothetical protein